MKEDIAVFTIPQSREERWLGAFPRDFPISSSKLCNLNVTVDQDRIDIIAATHHRYSSDSRLDGIASHTTAGGYLYTTFNITASQPFL